MVSVFMPVWMGKKMQLTNWILYDCNPNLQYLFRYSRKLLWCHLGSTNNDPAVVLGHYLETVAKVGGTAVVHLSVISIYCIASTDLIIGCPTVMRGDPGTESGLVATAQLSFRSQHNDDFACKSFIYGRSVSNSVR